MDRFRNSTVCLRGHQTDARATHSAKNRIHASGAQRILQRSYLVLRRRCRGIHSRVRREETWTSTAIAQVNITASKGEGSGTLTNTEPFPLAVLL